MGVGTCTRASAHGRPNPWFLDTFCVKFQWLSLPAVLKRKSIMCSPSLPPSLPPELDRDEENQKPNVLIKMFMIFFKQCFESFLDLYDKG
ncbi:hypothetical protein POPTR_014G025451v4 [Populus trichocarpa]|uniref:Uncharacterized protein n=1 Tax=Populus trichocarpa TaxID=3694 RepID=A0ACC0RWV6_POPTR|nr:hypothetical protein POPTR_014G025451v4 [Populus trichocarpa]